MLALSLDSATVHVRRVLAVGCHADDIEIGCGGTLLALSRARPELHVTWVVLSAADERADEARACAADFLAGAASSDVRVHDFRDGYLPHVGEAVKDVFEGAEGGSSPTSYSRIRAMTCTRITGSPASSRGTRSGIT